jgi:hypothetical protein
MWADDAHWLPALLRGDAFDASFTFRGHDTILRHSLRLLPPPPPPAAADAGHAATSCSCFYTAAAASAAAGGQLGAVGDIERWERA